eukprot:9385455-Alexandrium_andersonii.AAC.1
MGRDRAGRDGCADGRTHVRKDGRTDGQTPATPSPGQGPRKSTPARAPLVFFARNRAEANSG